MVEEAQGLEMALLSRIYGIICKYASDFNPFQQSELSKRQLGAFDLDPLGLVQRQ